MCIRDRDTPWCSGLPRGPASPARTSPADQRVLTGAMSLNDEYAPSPAQWVRDQVEEYEGSGGTSGSTLRGMPVIIVTTRGAKSGKLRKVPLMRVEHDGEYAAVASMGGACLLYTSPSPRDGLLS